MLLGQVRLLGLGPFEDLAVSLTDAEGAPRKRVVLFGGEGVGKTVILSAIATTRPGHAVAQLHARGNASPAPCVVADWILSDDDPARPHPLRIMSPNAKLDEPEDVALLRRREQTLFERRAAEGGFVLVSFSGARWFSRTPVLLTTPERTILRYDLRASSSFDDATRADLTRETKQVISLIAISSALSRGSEPRELSFDQRRFEALDRSLREVLDALLEDAGIKYLGVDPTSLEPTFSLVDGRTVEFDDLPRSARHLCAFGALTLRAVAAAYPGKDAREAEAVVLLDDIEVHQDHRQRRPLSAILARALPNVQWIMTTASPPMTLGCDFTEVLALRRSSSGRVELYEGPEAVMH